MSPSSKSATGTARPVRNTIAVAPATVASRLTAIVHAFDEAGYGGYYELAIWSRGAVEVGLRRHAAANAGRGSTFFAAAKFRCSRSAASRRVISSTVSHCQAGHELRERARDRAQKRAFAERLSSTARELACRTSRSRLKSLPPASAGTAATSRSSPTGAASRDEKWAASGNSIRRKSATGSSTRCAAIRTPSWPPSRRDSAPSEAEDDTPILKRLSLETVQVPLQGRTKHSVIESLVEVAGPHVADLGAGDRAQRRSGARRDFFDRIRERRRHPAPAKSAARRLGPVDRRLWPHALRHSLRSAAAAAQRLVLSRLVPRLADALARFGPAWAG